MAERELPQNSPHRFSKRSSQLVRDRIADVGCAGGVYRWRERSLGPAVVLWIHASGQAQVHLDGEPWTAGPRPVAPGPHVLAIELSGLTGIASPLVACALTRRRGHSPHESVVAGVVTTPDGSWRYATREPAGDWLRVSEVTKGWPRLERRPWPKGEEQPTLAVYRLQGLDAVPLAPPTSAKRGDRLWIVRAFELREEEA